MSNCRRASSENSRASGGPGVFVVYSEPSNLLRTRLSALRWSGTGYYPYHKEGYSLKFSLVKKVVVIGGSAGGITALCKILNGIPKNFSAPLLAVIHMGEAENGLVEVLQRCSEVTVANAKRPAPLRPGRLYLAAPNRHLIVKEGCAASVMGPRENRHRPAVDALFRSAARAYRRSVVGVVLSGALDDGSSGALAIKSRGGTVIVQDPADAEVRDMPSNVLKHVSSARRLKLDQIPSELIRLTEGGTELPKFDSRTCGRVKKPPVAADNEPVALTCPECGGALLEMYAGKTLQWRCHVGHRFSLESFSEAHSDAVERALWWALRKLRERQTVEEHLARNCSLPKGMKRRFQENGAAAASDIRLLEEVLTHL